MARKNKGASDSWKVGTVNSGANLDVPFFPQPDMAEKPRSSGSSTSKALEAYLRGGK